MSETDQSAEVQAALASLAPIVEWMKANGVKRFENNGMSVDLDIGDYAVSLRQQLDTYKAQLVKAGLLGPVKSRYAVPGMPLDPRQDVEED